MQLENTKQQTSNPTVKVNKVDMLAPLNWLAKGFSDLKTSKTPSLIYGLIFVVIGIFLLFIAKGNPIWSTILISAFLLVGPFIAIGLYELSRQIEDGERPRLLDSLKKIQSNATSLGFFAVLLGIILMLWLRLSTLVAGVFFNDVELVTQGWNVLFNGGRSLEFLLFFTVVGFFIAQVVFSISVVSIPMLLHRKVDIITAITTSLRVVMKNPLPMLLWAIIIVILINVGMLLAFIGLAITLPIIGHASWHAYRELVGE